MRRIAAGLVALSLLAGGVAWALEETWSTDKNAATHYVKNLPAPTLTTNPVRVLDNPPAVANVTALEAVPGALYHDGSVIRVSTLQADFVFHATSSATVDHITVASASGASGSRWIRVPTPGGAWFYQTAYYVGGSGASDENNCTATGTPCATFAELRRRILGRAIQLGATQSFTVNVQGNLGDFDPISIDMTTNARNTGIIVTVLGTPTTASLGTISARTLHDHSTGALDSITIPALDWTPYIGRIIRRVGTSGATGETAVVVAAPSLGVATITEVNTNTVPGTAFAVSDAVEVLTMPKAQGARMNFPGFMSVHNVDFAPAATGVAFATQNGGMFLIGSTILGSTSGQFVDNGTGIGTKGSSFATRAFSVAGNLSCDRTLFRSASVTIANSRVGRNEWQESIFDNSTIVISEGVYLRFHAVGIYNLAASASWLTLRSTAQADFTDYIFGAGNHASSLIFSMLTRTTIRLEGGTVVNDGGIIATGMTNLADVFGTSVVVAPGTLPYYQDVWGNSINIQIASDTPKHLAVAGTDITAQVGIGGSWVTAIHETAGPTQLTFGAIANGEFLVRSGTTVVGSTGGGFVPTSRTVTGTAPILIAGDNAAHDLSANRTWSLAFDNASLTLSGGNALQVGAFTGDATKTNGGTALTLATVNGNVGSFTNASITVNAKGLITAASSGATPALAARTLTAGAGMTGGGDLSADRTFDVVAGDATLVVAANSIVAGVMQTANYAADSVTFAKLPNATGASLLVGRGSAGGGGDFQEITLGSGMAMTGTVLSATATTVADADYGDITVSGTGTVWTIDNNVVSNAKLRDSGALSIIGRSVNTGGDPADISAVAGSDCVYREGSSTIACGTVATGGIANNAITDAKIRAFAGVSVLGRGSSSSGNGADITAGADGDVLRRASGTLAFGSIPVASVTGALADPGNNGSLYRTSSGVTSALNGTTGSVMFFGSTGVPAQDNANFSWDDSLNVLNLSGGVGVSGEALRVGGAKQVRITGSSAGTAPSLAIENTSAASTAFTSMFFLNDGAKRGDIYFTSTTYATSDSAPSSLTFSTSPTSGSIIFAPKLVRTLSLDGANSTFETGNALFSKAGVQLIEKQGSGDFYVGTLGAQLLGFYTNNVTRMTVSSGGVVAIPDLGSGGVVQAAASTGALSENTISPEVIPYGHASNGGLSTQAGLAFDTGGDGYLSLSDDVGFEHFNLGSRLGDTNSERVTAKWIADVWTLKSLKSGSGTVRPMMIDADTATLTLDGNITALTATVGVTATAPTVQIDASSDVFINGDASVVIGTTGGLVPSAALTPTQWKFQTANTITSATSATLDTILFDSTGPLISGSTTPITTSSGVNNVAFATPFYSGGGVAKTISHAATVAIYGAPSGTNGVTITQARALWVQGGGTQLDGGVGFGTPPVARPSTTGSRASGAALADLLSDLASMGLIDDNTTP